MHVCMVQLPHSPLWTENATDSSPAIAPALQCGMQFLKIFLNLLAYLTLVRRKTPPLTEWLFGNCN